MANKKLISFGSHGCKRLQRECSMDFSDFSAPHLQLLLWQRKKVTLCKTQKRPQNRLVYFVFLGRAVATALFAG